MSVNLLFSDLTKVERPSHLSYYNENGELVEAEPNTPAFDHDPMTLRPLGLKQSQDQYISVAGDYPPLWSTTSRTYVLDFELGDGEPIGDDLSKNYISINSRDEWRYRISGNGRICGRTGEGALTLISRGINSGRNVIVFSISPTRFVISINGATPNTLAGSFLPLTECDRILLSRQGVEEYKGWVRKLFIYNGHKGSQEVQALSEQHFFEDLEGGGWGVIPDMVDQSDILDRALNQAWAQ